MPYYLLSSHIPSDRKSKNCSNFKIAHKNQIILSLLWCFPACHFSVVFDHVLAALPVSQYQTKFIFSKICKLGSISSPSTHTVFFYTLLTSPLDLQSHPILPKRKSTIIKHQQPSRIHIFDAHTQHPRRWLLPIHHFLPTLEMNRKIKNIKKENLLIFEKVQTASGIST